MTQEARRRAEAGSKLHWALAGGVLLALAVGVSISEGRGALGHGAVIGCADRKGGALEIVLKGQRCDRGERKLTWGVPGPRGSRGAEGARGAEGPAGQTGASGERGPRGDFTFDDFGGMDCNDGSPGAIDVSHDGAGFVTFTCEP